MKRRRKGTGSIYRSGTGWTAEISLGYDTRTGARLRKRATAATKKEAGEKLKAMLTASDIATSSITLTDWINVWYIGRKRHRLRENTGRMYEHYLDVARKHFPFTPLSAIGRQDVQKLIDTEFAGHYRAAQHFHTVLKMAFDEAIKEGLISINPAEDAELPPKQRKKRFAKPSLHDWERLLNAHTPLYCWRMIILTEMVTGLRRSEILALRWGEIADDAEGGTLRVKKALIIGRKDEADGRRVLIRANTKSEAGERLLPLPPSYMAELSLYQQFQTEKIPRNTGGLLFTDKNGEAINPDTFSNLYYRVRKRLGIETTFHQLRHDMATSMKEAGIFDMKDIQSQMGHESIKITMDTYTHTGEKTRQKVSRWAEMRINKSA